MSTSLIKFLGLSIVVFSLLPASSWGAELSCPRGANESPDIIFIPDEAVEKYKLDTVKDQQKEDKEVTKGKKIKIKHFDDRMNVQKETGCFFTVAQVTGQSADCTTPYDCGYNAGLGVVGPKGTNGVYHSISSLSMEDLESQGFKGAIKSTLKAVQEKTEDTSEALHGCSTARGVLPIPGDAALNAPTCWAYGRRDGFRQYNLNLKNPASGEVPAVPVAVAPTAAAPAPDESLQLPPISDDCLTFDNPAPAGTKDELCGKALKCKNSNGQFAATCGGHINENDNCDTVAGCLDSYTKFCNGASGACNVVTPFKTTTIKAGSSNVTVAGLSKEINDAKDSLDNFENSLGDSKEDVRGCALSRVNVYPAAVLYCDPNDKTRVLTLKAIEKWLNNPEKAQTDKADYFMGALNKLTAMPSQKFFTTNGIQTPTSDEIEKYAQLQNSFKTLINARFFQAISTPGKNNLINDPMATLKRAGTDLSCIEPLDSSITSRNLQNQYLSAVVADANRVKNLNTWLNKPVCIQKYREGKSKPAGSGKTVKPVTH